MKKLLVALCILLVLLSACEKSPVDDDPFKAEIDRDISSSAEDSGPSPESPSSNSALILKAILLGQATFVDALSGESFDLSQVQKAVTPDESITIMADRFTVIDLDGDSESEVVVSLTVNDTISYGYMVLREQDGIVYDYIFSQREFGEVKSDGSFASSGGSSDVGICTISFDKNTYSVDKVTYCQSNLEDIMTYVVNHEPATQEEYDQAFHQWQKIPYAQWYPLTEENIEMHLSYTLSPPDSSESDYEFAINEDGTVTITKYVGSGGDVVVPAELDGRKVTAIGNTFGEAGAFQNCTTLISVVIPEGVTEIQDNAFYGCSNLETVTIASSVTLLRTCAFDGCSSLLSVYFEGEPPQLANYVFEYNQDRIFYYHEGTPGWTDVFYNTPTQAY